MRILAVNNWPESLTAEYELIARLKNSVACEEINRYGYSLETGKMVDFDKFEFALYFHYEAPPILPIKSYLALINPLSFYYLDNKPTDMKSRVDLFDGYITNLSSKMEKFNSLIGVNSLCEKSFFLPTLGEDQIFRMESYSWHEKLDKIFYAGINWDFANKLRKSNLAGEPPQELPKLNKKGEIINADSNFSNDLSLEEKINFLGTEDTQSKGELNNSRTRILNFLDTNVVDIYGPKFINGFFTWVGRSNYKGEIPFDGYSLIKKMSEYKFTLCINSIDHQYWQTTSSRVFESIGSGSMPITNKNAHVKDIFGKYIEYYDGNSINDKEKIISSFQECIEDPDKTNERLKKCQEIISEYTLEESIKSIYSFHNSKENFITNESINFQIIKESEVKEKKFDDNKWYIFVENKWKNLIGENKIIYDKNLISQKNLNAINVCSVISTASSKNLLMIEDNSHKYSKSELVDQFVNDKTSLISSKNSLYPHFLRDLNLRDYLYLINRESRTVNLSVLSSYNDLVDYSLTSAQVLIKGRLINKHIKVLNNLFELKGLFLVMIALLEEPNFLKNKAFKWQGLYSPEGARLFNNKFNLINSDNLMQEDEIVSKKMNLWVEGNTIVDYILSSYAEINTEINNFNIRKMLTDVILEKYKFTS